MSEAFQEVLTLTEYNDAKALFDKYDPEEKGFINVFELLKLMAESPARSLATEEVLSLLHEVDPDNNGTLRWDSFLHMMRLYKTRFRGVSNDADTIAAFVALGGNPDKSGQIRGEMLADVCKDLGLTINIQELLHEIDQDGSGFVDFDEFSALLKDKLA